MSADPLQARVAADRPPQDSACLRDVYEEQYSSTGAEAMLYAGWRELCGAGKADHVVQLLEALPEPPHTIADVGCGDGVLMTLLARRGVGVVRHGYDISARAVSVAGTRPEIERAERFDGLTLPVADGAYDLGVLSHVLEHVPDPLSLLRETARACRAVVVEVPLEDNASASRPSAQRGRDAIGHLHRFSRAHVHELVARAGLQIAAELADPLPRAVHRYFADTPASALKATVKAAGRRAIFTAAPRRAERLFTVHYACVCILPA